MKTYSNQFDVIRVATAVVVLVAMTLVATTNGFAQINFDPATTYVVGQRPGGIASGDWDGDGDNDLAVVTDGPTGFLELIEIWLNDGSGAFSFGGQVLLPNSSSPTELVAADLDGDSDMDLAVILRDFFQVQTVFNNGGVFTLGGTATVGDRARGMTTGDYDSDGDIDIAVANRDDNTATVLTNNGVGGFSSTTIPAGNEPRAAAFVAIDAGPDVDLAITNHDDRTVSLYTNTGGVFTNSGTLSVGFIHRPDGIVAADVDGNGTQDLAVAISDDAQPDAAMVFLNGGNGFGPGTMYLTGGLNTSGIIADDFNCDGAMDLATLNQDSNNLSVLENIGAGTFGAAYMIAAGARPDQLIASDLDGDGDSDMAVSNRDSNSMSVVMNQSCSGGVTFVQELNVIVGLHEAGQVSDMDDSDDVYVRIFRGNPFSVTSPSVWLEATSTLPTDNPTALSFTYESKVNTFFLTQELELFNYNTGQYELIDSRDASVNVDSIVQADATGDVTRFVEAGTGAVKMRITYTESGAGLFLAWRVWIDQLNFSYQ